MTKMEKAKGWIKISPNGDTTRGESRALQIVFEFFVPERMGIIDYPWLLPKIRKRTAKNNSTQRER